MFVDFDISHRMASLQKLYSVTSTYIFDFKWLKYAKFVRIRMLPEAKIIKKKQQYKFKYLRSNGVSTVFLLCDLDLHFLGQKFKI